MEQRERKPRILVFCDYYLPGYKSGGALRTLVNMVDRLSDRFDFRIVARDHDGKLDRTQYTTVDIDAWNIVGPARVYYFSKRNLRPATMKRLIDEVLPDAIYLNSFFATPTVFVLMLRRLRRIPTIPVIFAPEGEFSEGALTIKPFKKWVYVALSKAAGLYKGVVWKAASESEREDIERNSLTSDGIFVAPNMPPKTIFLEYSQSFKPEKYPGSAKIVFLSRFMRKKNFNWLIPHLREVVGELEIYIYGPLEEADYWEECQELMADLPANIRIAAKGPVPHQEVLNTLARHHFFLLPTLGENFGHIFLEALAAGCPLVISDTTPWRDLEAIGVGWDMPLDRPRDWIDVLNRCVAMDREGYERLSARAREYALEWLSDKGHEESNVDVLNRALTSFLPKDEPDRRKTHAVPETAETRDIV